MATCSITFSDGESLEVQGKLQTVIDELHEVASRREHSFAVLQDTDGRVVAVRPEAVLHVRPLS
jgi:ABC-type phosphate transport system auxiliary subunit